MICGVAFPLTTAIVVGLAGNPTGDTAVRRVDIRAAALRLAADDQGAPEHGTVSRLVRDVGSDFKNFFSVETGEWLGVGGVAALAVHRADEPLSGWVTERNGVSLPGASTYGSQLVHIPIAFLWWGVASLAGSERHAETGRDLVRVQVSVAAWTYALKLATNRTRPNGDPHSFPSGHASTTFGTAMVLQEHYGWKVGLPAFIAASYVGASRVGDNQHWASDVVFGAALGMACGRTVTIRLRDTRVTVAPLAVPAGGGVFVTVVR